MPGPGGFLLADDATSALKSRMDAWVKEQEDKAAEAARAAQAAAAPVTQPVVQAAQQVATPVGEAVQNLQQGPSALQQQMDQWIAQQLAAEQQRAPTAAVAPPAAPPPASTLTPPNPTAVGAGNTLGEQMDDWVRQQLQALQTAAQPVQAAVTGAVQQGQAALPHSEEPATATDVHPGPDLGGNWKTQFDFGQTYTGDYRTGTPHRGVDLVPSSGKGIGTEVDAFAPGTVTNIFRDNGAGGLIVYVQDDQGLTHAYMHLAGTQPGLAVGQHVDRGQPIALMGESGTEGSPHLHYEVRKNASNGDPLDQLIDPRPYVSGAKQPGGQPSVQAAQPAAQAGQPPNVRLDASSQDSFYSSLAPAAQWIQQKTGIDPTAMLAIVANETGYGRSENARDKNNLFSIQGDGSNGSRWASYNSPLESFQAFADLISKAPRYAQAWADRANPLKFIDDLRNAGYVADEPGYPAQGWVDQVKAIIGRVPESVTQTVDTARQAATNALNQTVDASGQVRSAAENVANAGKTQLQLLQDQTAALQDQFNKLQAQLQAQTDAFNKQQAQFTEGVNQQIAKTQADIMAPRDFGAPLRQAQETGQAILNSEPARQAQAALSAAPTPFNYGTSLGETAQNIQQLPSNLQQLGQGALGAATEAERQMNEPGPLTQAARAGASLSGGQLPPEVEAGIEAATPPMLRMPDVGGVVAQFLKSGNIVPASQTVNLPFVGETPIADIIGLASNLVIPTGMEERFATSAAQRALNRAAFETQQATRVAAPSIRGAITGALEHPGSQAAWAAALGSKITEGSTAARMAISGAGRWARASVRDIADDLAKGPIGEFARSESGEIDIGRLIQIATKIRQEMVRVYSGTVGEYDRADLARANPEGLYGPGYYTTDDPRIAGGRVTEAKSGWAAEFPVAGGGFRERPDYGPIYPTYREAQAAHRADREALLAQYSGLTRRDVPARAIVRRSEPGGVVEAEGYAQAAGERAGFGDQGTIDSLQRNIARYQKQVEDTQDLIAQAGPDAVHREGMESRKLSDWLTYHQDDLADAQSRLERVLNQPAGPTVRPINVPRDLNLFDADAGMSSRELYDLADHAASRGMAQTERTLIDQALTSMRNYPPTGSEVYDALQHEAGLSKTQINNFLESAGFHGIQHQGGAIRPMLDEAGNPIQHTTRVLFQSGLDRSQNMAGGLAGAVPNAAIGGAAGAGTGDEDLSPQERLYRGLGGAFVAGALRNKNPAVAAFEAQALRRGATATQIAAAVQTARKEAGKAWKFSGPIADAANAAFKAAPGADQVVAARQMLRDFGDKAALLRAAPPNAQTDSGAARLHNMLMEMARQGESQRFWYTNASEAIKEAAQGDKQKAEKLAQLFAIYSPGATVSANTQMALAAWHQFLEGIPISVGKKQLDEKAQQLLYDNVPWEGRKTNNFYRNLMKRIDPDVWQSMGKEDGQTGTTVDIWMMRALKYLQDAPSMGEKGQYEFAQRAIERVAKDLGWQPDEAQAAIWSAMKAADEGTSLQEAGYHYGTGLAQRAGRVGELEPTPGIQGTLQRIFGLFGGEGTPALPAEKGSRTLYDEAGNAIRNAKGEAISENIPENKGMLSAAANQTVSAYAAARAWLEKRPEISWARVFPDNKPTLRDSNALVVKLDRPMTAEEAQQLRTTLGPTVTVTPTDTGAWIINQDGRHVRTPNVPGAPKEENLAGQWVGSDNRAFHKQAEAAVKDLPTVPESSTYPLRADSTTLRNDWSQAPNGEDYAHVINGSLRAGAFWDVADPLAKRVADATGADASHAAAVPELRSGARPSPELPGGVPGAADIGGPAADVGRAADTGAAAAEAGAAEAAPGAARGVGGAVRDFLTGPESEAGSIGLGAMSRIGGAGLGVASQEATMSEQDKQDPLGRYSRDMAAAILGAATPRLAGAALRGGVNYRDLAAVRTPQQASLLTAPSKGQTPAQVVSAYTKQNLLSGAKTSVTNIASQLVELAHQPLSNIAAGHEEDAVAGIRAAGQAVPDAFKNFARTLSTGQTQFTRSQNATGAWLPALRLLSATDDFFRTIGWAMGAGQEGQRLLRESGAGASGASSVLSANATRISEAGDKAGRMSVFGEGTGPGQAISNLKNRLLGSASYKDQALGMLLDAGIPFSAVPGRIWSTGIKRMPGIGEARALRNAGIAIKEGDTYAFQKAMGDMAVQSVIDASIISNIANGNIRGPDDKEHPSGIKLNGQWYDYSSWGAWVLPMALPAAWYEGIRQEGNKPDANFAKAWTNATGKVLVNQLYAADLIKTLNRIGSGDAYGGVGQLALGYADRYLPASAALNTATSLWDPIMRDPANSGLQAVWERQQAKIPFAEAQLPTQPNMLTGQPEERRSYGPGQLIGMQTRTEVPLATAIAALERKGYQIPDPTRVPTQVSLEGSTIPLTEAEGRALAAKRGQLIDRVLGAYVTSPGFEKLTDDQKARAISARLSDIDNDTAQNWAQMTPAADRAARIARNRTVVGRLEPQLAGSR